MTLLHAQLPALLAGSPLSARSSVSGKLPNQRSTRRNTTKMPRPNIEALPKEERFIGAAIARQQQRCSELDCANGYEMPRLRPPRPDRSRRRRMVRLIARPTNARSRTAGRSWEVRFRQFPRRTPDQEPCRCPKSLLAQFRKRPSRNRHRRLPLPRPQSHYLPHYGEWHSMNDRGTLRNLPRRQRAGGNPATTNPGIRKSSPTTSITGSANQDRRPQLHAHRQLELRLRERCTRHPPVTASFSTNSTHFPSRRIRRIRRLAATSTLTSDRSNESFPASERSRPLSPTNSPLHESFTACSQVDHSGFGFLRTSAAPASITLPHSFRVSAVAIARLFTSCWPTAGSPSFPPGHQRAESSPPSPSGGHTLQEDRTLPDTAFHEPSHRPPSDDSKCGQPPPSTLPLLRVLASSGRRTDSRCEICLAGASIVRRLRFPPPNESPILRPSQPCRHSEQDRSAQRHAPRRLGATPTKLHYRREPSEATARSLIALPRAVHDDFIGWRQFNAHLRSMRCILPKLREIENLDTTGAPLSAK